MIAEDACQETVESAPLAMGPAARYVGVHPQTLRRWANLGMLPYTTTAGGHRRFKTDDLDVMVHALTVLNRRNPQAS